MTKFMELAIAEAEKCVIDVPVGAVIVRQGEVISSGFNTKEIENDATCHAEITALRNAFKSTGNRRLENCDMYVTLEPCPMCGWAVLQSGIKNLYFGSYDSQYGAFSSKIDLRIIANSSTKIFGGIMEEKCDKILNDFFKKLRNKN